MVEWTTAASLVARGAKASYDNRHSIQQLWKRLMAHVDKGATDVLVTGHSGAGKTTLVSHMHSEARAELLKTASESMTVEVEAIAIGDWGKLFRVLPGQLGRRTEGELDHFDNNPDLEGLIHVTDFGFVAPRDAHIREEMASNKRFSSIEKLREHNLENEIKDLELLFNNIYKSQSKHKRPKWLVIAVNKVDLYKSAMNQALSFYHPDGNGEFGKKLSHYWGHLGRKNFGVYILPVCSDDLEFSWNSISYPSEMDRAQRSELLRDFTARLAQISEIHS